MTEDRVRRRLGSNVGVFGLAATVALAASIMTLRWLTGLEAPTSHRLPWWLLALGWVLVELFLVHFEHRRESHSLSLSTIPLVVGLFTLSPVGLIAARLAGSAAALALVRRQAPAKLAVNLASFWLATAIGAVIFHLLVPREGPVLLVWLAAFAAALASDQVQGVIVMLAIAIHQRRRTWALGPALLGPLATVVETSIALVAVALLEAEPVTLVLLCPIVPLLYVSYRVNTRLRDRNQELVQLHEFISHSGEAARDGRLLGTLLDLSKEAMHAERSWLSVRRADRSFDTVTGGEGQALRTSAVAPHSVEDLVHRAAQDAGLAVLLSRSDGTAEGSLLAGAGLGEAIGAPLLSASGQERTLVVADRSGDVRPFNDADLRLFATLSYHAGVALDNGHLVERLRNEAAKSIYQSLHDSLTGLPNRDHFVQLLAEVAANKGDVGVLVIDLDRFKEVNDTLGHHNGDELLRLVGGRLATAVRSDDAIARLGGDEFGVLLRDMPSTEAAVGMAHSIRSVLEQPFSVAGVAIGVEASVGVAMTSGSDADANVLLRRADVAMYVAKADQTGVEWYRPERDGNTPERLLLVAELRQALERHELEVHYQPQISTRGEHVIGAEALVRWRHPARGFVPPDEFIPMAERTGLITGITMFVLQQALADCTSWWRRAWPLRVSVNLSPRGLLHPSLVDDVCQMLASAELPANALCLELTETAIMADPRRSIEVLNRLDGAGVSLALDDFGTGYSSLDYLKRLPIGEIKIDKSFVMNMERDGRDAAIVRSSIDLASHLGFEVVAEGVETFKAVCALREMHCSVMQGYYFSKPLSADAFVAWLEPRYTSSGAPRSGAAQ